MAFWRLGQAAQGSSLGCLLPLSVAKSTDLDMSSRVNGGKGFVLTCKVQTVTRMHGADQGMVQAHTALYGVHVAPQWLVNRCSKHRVKHAAWPPNSLQSLGFRSAIVCC